MPKVRPTGQRETVIAKCAPEIKAAAKLKIWAPGPRTGPIIVSH
jgi:hypothetical protein